MLSVSQLFIYPVKSLGGISVSSAIITASGFKYDRKWMLVDKDLRCLTQRELPAMALLQVELTRGGLKVFHKEKPNCSILIPFSSENSETFIVKIFDETCDATSVSRVIDEWFSKMLSINCKLVYFPDTSARVVDKQYAINNETTNFTDGYPFLMLGQASLDDLNMRLAEKLPVNRFRPNIVFTGGQPYEEDSMAHFIINKIHFNGVKLCARCVITTVDQDKGVNSKEPLRTLATYRQKNNKIYFGQNLLAGEKGIISIGDAIQITEINFPKNTQPW